MSYIQASLTSVEELEGTEFRGATATNASKARALPKFWVTVNPISTRGADYAHHSTMGLVWLKFAVAPLITQEQITRLVLSCSSSNVRTLR